MSGRKSGYKSEMAWKETRVMSMPFESAGFEVSD